MIVNDIILKRKEREECDKRYYGEKSKKKK
jgi:hypothetical protein